MPQPNDLSRSLVALDQNSTIIAVVELSQSSWLVGTAGGATFFLCEHCLPKWGRPMSVLIPIAGPPAS